MGQCASWGENRFEDCLSVRGIKIDGSMRVAMYKIWCEQRLPDVLEDSHMLEFCKETHRHPKLSAKPWLTDEEIKVGLSDRVRMDNRVADDFINYYVNMQGKFWRPDWAEQEIEFHQFNEVSIVVNEGDEETHWVYKQKSTDQSLNWCMNENDMAKWVKKTYPYAFGFLYETGSESLNVVIKLELRDAQYNDTATFYKFGAPQQTAKTDFS